jgi:hypothetical protein
MHSSSFLLERAWQISPDQFRKDILKSAFDTQVRRTPFDAF